MYTFSYQLDNTFVISLQFNGACLVEKNIRKQLLKKIEINSYIYGRIVFKILCKY